MQDIAKENTAINEAALGAARAQSNAAIWGQIGQVGATVASVGISKIPTN
jgi:hypothetical protein